MKNKTILFGSILIVCVLAVVLLLFIWPDNTANTPQNSQQNSQQKEEDTSSKDSEKEPDTTTENTTETPSTEEPSTDAPSTEEPSTDAPSTEVPSTDTPSTDKPSTDTPSTDAPTTPSVNVDTSSLNGKIAALAAAQLGKSYGYGEEGPDLFDTSGLVYYCFTQNGIAIPRTVKEQATFGTEVSKENIQPGDVVFFWTDTPGTAQYVGIYIGDGKFVAARSTKKTVAELDFEGPYFSERFVSARRFW